MPVAKLPFASGFYTERTSSNADLRCENYYPHTPKGLGLNDRILRATHGVAAKGFIGNSGLGAEFDAVYGAVATEDRMYVVIQRLSGERLLYAIAISQGPIAGYTATLETAGDTYKVSYKLLDEEDPFGDPYGTFRDIAVSATHVVVVYANKGIAYNIATDTASSISDPDYTANGQPNGVTFVDGYFVFTTVDRKFIVSALNDPTSFNALDFGSAEMDPDGCVCPFVWRNQLYIGGTRTIEQFNNIGGVDFPFERTGQFFEVGINSARGVVAHETGIYFDGIGKNGERGIYRLTDQVEQISLVPLDLLYSEYAVIPDLFTFTYSFDDHEFIGFYPLRDSTCFVYDITEGAWHTRESGRFPNCVGAFSGRTVAVGGYVSGEDLGNSIGWIDGTTFTFHGLSTSRVFSTSPVHNETKPFSITSLEVTTDTDQASGFTLEISEDGGNSWTTFGTVTHSSPAASDRYIWRRLGRADETMQYRFTSAVSSLPHHAYQLTANISD